MSTIAAIATAQGAGGISIVRLSGPQAEDILQRLFQPAGRAALPLESHRLTYGHILWQGETIDECMAVLMRAPRSYTREDVVELQLHGGGAVAQRVLALCVACGAALAEPGEFTRRAFLNGRMDLSQAEAVMALVSAQGEQARQAAIRQLEGGTAAFIRQASDRLYDIQAAVAACIDYPEEISEEEALGGLQPKVEALAAELSAAADERSAHILRDGLQVALVGQPNVGKSSLLNALLREDRAIVTAVPGTTRDTVAGTLTLGGCPVHLTDTAGLRETADTVERIGVARTRQAMAQADVLLVVLDASRPLSEEEHSLLKEASSRDALVLLNKCDLPQVLTPPEVQALAPRLPVLCVSALEESSLQPLREALTAKARVSDRLVLSQPRHVEAARRAARHLQDAAAAMDTGIDLCSVDLLAAQQALAEITGDSAEEALLDRVFSSFCVGK